MSNQPQGRAQNPGSSHAWSPGELKEIVTAEKQGGAFLVFRNPEGIQVIVRLAQDAGPEQLTVGRSSDCEVDLSGDPEVSRTHCILERIGGDWTIDDDGLSRNGSFVNGKRIMGRSRLHDRDVIRCGQTMILFRETILNIGTVTSVASASLATARITDAQLKVLQALARPCMDAGQFSAPASNKEIAEELFLSLDTVKTHLRALFQAFDLDEVPQNQKRLKLVEAAINTGMISADQPKRP